MQRYNSSVIGKKSTVNSGGASGIFSLNNAADERRASNWPANAALEVTFDGTLTDYAAGQSLYIYYQSNNYYTLGFKTGFSYTIHMWGASGGGGKYSANYFSGAGGLVYGTYTPTSDTTAYLYIGQGGDGADSTTVAGIGGWPNGGDGTQGDASGSGGGGMSMLSTATYSTSMSNSDILLIAGAGGGATGYIANAGFGGGTEGGNGGLAGQKGTQSAGGTYNGAYLVGGDATGGVSSGSDDGGGGGGGYYGGGGGTSDAKPGGGGSGFINTTSQITNSGFVTYDYASVGGPDRNNLRSAAETANSPTKYAQSVASSTSGGELDGNNGLVHISIATA